METPEPMDLSGDQKVGLESYNPWTRAISIRHISGEKMPPLWLYDPKHCLPEPTKSIDWNSRGVPCELPCVGTRHYNVVEQQKCIYVYLNIPSGKLT